jgi:C4-dicarboxylate transporter, DctM subunit
MGWVLAFLPLILLVIGFPIFLILLTTVLVVLLFFMNVPLTVVHQVMFDSLNKFALLAVPFFIFAGDLMTRGGMSTRLLRWVSSMVGSVRGSLPLTSLGFAAVFGAISGATTATVAAVGSLTYPRMRKAGYDERFASALITAEGAIDNLIPPSIGMIIYGIAADTSVIALFAAGIGPGVLLAALFGIYIYWYAAHLNLRETERFSFSDFLAASMDGVWALGAIVVILGGIYSGVFSPTEAAGVACVYAIIVSTFVYRGVTFSEIFDISARTIYLTALIFTIVAVASVYAWLLTISGVAVVVTDFISAMQVPPWGVLLFINLFLLFIGCFLDTPTALLVLTPLLVPIAKSIGVDPVHFGVIVVMNLTIGTFTPPFGLNIFVCQALFKVPSSVLYPGLVPFIVIAIFALMIVTYFPPLSLWILKYLL